MFITVTLHFSDSISTVSSRLAYTETSQYRQRRDVCLPATYFKKLWTALDEILSIDNIGLGQSTLISNTPAHDRWFAMGPNFVYMPYMPTLTYTVIKFGTLTKYGR